MQQDAGAVPASSWRSRLFTLARIAIAVAILASVGVAIARSWPDVRGTLAHLGPVAVAASVVFACLGMMAAVMSWRAVMRALDVDVAPVPAGQIYLVGQLGKYLPGSVWAFVLQMELAHREGVERARAFVGSLVTAGIGVVAALVVGVALLPSIGEIDPQVSALVVALLVVALVCVHPRVLSWLVDTFLRVIRRQPLGHRMSWSGIGAALGWAIVALVLLGTHLYVLVEPVSSAGPAGWVRCVAGFGLAMTVSLLAFLVPSGLGVREAIIVGALAPFATSGVALGLALASRVVLTVTEVLVAGIAAGMAVRRLRRGVDTAATPSVSAPSAGSAELSRA
jgi:hypothetical protein